jgi:hypothetical protein
MNYIQLNLAIQISPPQPLLDIWRWLSRGGYVDYEEADCKIWGIATMRYLAL